MTLGSIGSRIKELRKKQNITQKELAILLEKSESTIQKYEADKIDIPPKIMKQIADKLNTTTIFLYGYENAQRELDEMKAFNYLLKSIGYERYTVGCSNEELIQDDNGNYLDEDSNNILGCEIPVLGKLECSNCILRNGPLYILESEQVTIKVPCHVLDNLQDEFISFLKFKVEDLAKKYSK